MKISLAHKSASKLIAVRAETNKSISELMEEAMQLLIEEYNIPSNKIVSNEVYYSKDELVKAIQTVQSALSK